MNTAGAIIVVLVLLVLGILAFRLSSLLARRSISTVITLFRRQKAVQMQNARSLKELGINMGFHLKFFRDYKPWAFKRLVQAGIIREAFEGTYYLSEEQLARSDTLGRDNA